jgi:hypothetical protein
MECFVGLADEEDVAADSCPQVEISFTGAAIPQFHQANNRGVQSSRGNLSQAVHELAVGPPAEGLAEGVGIQQVHARLMGQDAGQVRLPAPHNLVDDLEEQVVVLQPSTCLGQMERALSNRGNPSDRTPPPGDNDGVTFGHHPLQQFAEPLLELGRGNRKRGHFDHPEKNRP